MTAQTHFQKCYKKSCSNRVKKMKKDKRDLNLDPVRGGRSVSGIFQRDFVERQPHGATFYGDLVGHTLVGETCNQIFGLKPLGVATRSIVGPIPSVVPSLPPAPLSVQNFSIVSTCVLPASPVGLVHAPSFSRSVIFSTHGHHVIVFFFLNLEKRDLDLSGSLQLQQEASSARQEGRPCLSRSVWRPHHPTDTSPSHHHHHDTVT